MAPSRPLPAIHGRVSDAAVRAARRRSPPVISRSVPQTPSANVRTRTDPSDNGGSAISSSRAESAIPGETVSARIPFALSRVASQAGDIATSVDRTNAISHGPAKVPSQMQRNHRLTGVVTFLQSKAARCRPLDAGGGRSPKATSPLKAHFPIRTLVSHETACILNAGRSRRPCGHHDLLRRPRAGWPVTA